MERIWIYVISKELSESQLSELSEKCRLFVNSWTAHEQKLNSSFEIYKKQLLIIKVDETSYNASGCSIDKQLNFVKQIEKDLSVELLNRLLVAYEVGGDVRVVHSSNVRSLIHTGDMNENTLIFDNSIAFADQMQNWKKPLKDTWLNKYLPSYSS